MSTLANSSPTSIREHVLRDPTSLPGALIDPATEAVVASAANLAKGLQISGATVSGWARTGRIALHRAGDASLYSVVQAASLALLSRRGRPTKAFRDLRITTTEEGR